MKVLPLFFLNNCPLFIIVQYYCWIDLNSIQLKKQQQWYIYYASSVAANLKKKNNWQKHVIIFWLFLKNEICIRATYRAKFWMKVLLSEKVLFQSLLLDLVSLDGILSFIIVQKVFFGPLWNPLSILSFSLFNFFSFK